MALAIRRWLPCDEQGFSSMSQASNHQLLAQRIYNVENANYKQVRKWHKNGVTQWGLLGGVYMERSDDCMCWYLWRSKPDQARLFCKVVPRFHLSVQTIEAILAAQPWVCI